MQILVVEDEPRMAGLLQRTLEEEGHQVVLASDGREGLEIARGLPFDVVVLDVMLPGMDGVTVARKLREGRNQTPVLLLTARDTPADIVKGLDAGADDYLTKPFSIDILLARLRAISRRGSVQRPVQLEIADVRLDPASRRVTRGDQPVNLTTREYKLLELLMRNRDRAVSRDTILESVWGFSTEVSENNVEVFVRQLRLKLDTGEPKLIHTVRGFGYMMRGALMLLRNRSIRFRLTAWYALILTAGLGLFGGLLWISLRHQLIGGVDRDIEGRASRFESYFRAESAEGVGPGLRDELEEFCQALPPDSYISLRGAHGFSFHYPALDRAPRARFRMLQRQFNVDGGAFDLEVGAPITDVRHTLDLLWLLLWSLLPVVIVIACLGGFWLSGRALKPVRDVTASALNVGIGNLSERLPVPPTGDELARLAVVLNSMLDRLEAAVQTLSQFAADASHELRTPLAVIRTTAELALRRGRTPESYRESLQTVSDEAERMTQLIEDLLVLARGGAAAEMPREPLDVRGVLREVCSETRGLAEARGITVRETMGGEAAVIAGNRAALHRLFLVLFDNALKYSQRGGEVILAVAKEDDRVSVTVEDFGSGIRAADLPHIFKRFYRADPARHGGGHGLGLSFAESIARAHGAEIHVVSAEGRGSQFQVVFPARDFTAPEAPQPILSFRPYSS